VGGEYREGARGIVLKLEQLHGYKYKQNTPPSPANNSYKYIKKSSLQRRLFLLFFENLVFMRFCGGVFAHDADFARIAARKSQCISFYLSSLEGRSEKR
jgi:hypothetical protein